MMVINKNKLTDERKGKDKAFQEIAHSHQENPTRGQSLDCIRCIYDAREKSLEDFILNTSNTATHKFRESGAMKTRTLKKLKVLRGKHDDCMGWIGQWQ